MKVGGGDNTLFQGVQFRRGNGQSATGWACFFRGLVGRVGNVLACPALVSCVGKPISSKPMKGRGGVGQDKPVCGPSFVKTSVLSMGKITLFNIMKLIGNILQIEKLPLCRYC